MKPRLKPLSEQIIVITGATSGIGLCTARRAAARGARLVLAARNEEALQQINDELNKQGAQSCHVVADVAREDDVRRLAAVAIERYGGFDTWMNIAGVGMFGKNEQVAVADMRQLFDINFWGVVYGSLAALPQLKARGGALINMGSETSDRSVPLQGIYAASKQAVKGFTDALRMELEEEDAPVSVTLIKPASVDTMFVRHAKNYLEGEPRLPPPIYTPEIVAEALLYAAEHPVCDLPVGSRAFLSSLGAGHVPRLLDRVMERFMYRGMETDRPEHDRADNNLYEPRADLLERGGVGGKPRTSLYTQAALHPAATKAAVLGASLLLAGLWQARRRA